MDYTLVLMDDTRDWLSQHENIIMEALPTQPRNILRVVDTEQRGYTAQSRFVWEELRKLDTEYVLFWEADFRPITPVPLAGMEVVLRFDPDLAQVALLRQPWFANEVAAGGLIEALEAQGQTFYTEQNYIKHRSGWTCNPCLFERKLADKYEWPDTAWSESRFGRILREDGFSFAYYGTARTPMVEHVGVRTEVSHGY